MQVYEFVAHDEPDKQNFIVMDLKGQNLATYKKTLGKHFIDTEAISLLLQMLEAIKLIHEAGLIHRDIKPVKIHMVNTFAVKLCDRKRR